MLTDELIRGQAQHLIGALLAHNFVPKTLPEELYVKLWDVVMAQLKCVNHEGARAIESAATAPLLAEIERLTRELEEARKDAERLDWLDNNVFAKDPDEWDQKYGRCRDGKTQMWAIFSPKGVHGSARRIIDAAIKEQT